MGYQITYVLDLAGTAFNERLDSSCRASDNELRHYLKEDACWEGRLPNSDVNLIVDLTGAVTLIVHPQKYSAFLYNQQVRAKVMTWELNLKQLIPLTTILRVDEFVLQDWEDIAGEFWFRNTDGFDLLWNWLNQKARDGWAKI